MDASQKQPMTVLVPFALSRLSSRMSQESLPWESSSLQDLEEGSTGPQGPQPVI